MFRVRGLRVKELILFPGDDCFARLMFASLTLIWHTMQYTERSGLIGRVSAQIQFPRHL